MFFPLLEALTELHKSRIAKGTNHTEVQQQLRHLLKKKNTACLQDQPCYEEDSN